jgi:hypothetical protein
VFTLAASPNYRGRADFSCVSFSVSTADAVAHAASFGQDGQRRYGRLLFFLKAEVILPRTGSMRPVHGPPLKLAVLQLYKPTSVTLMHRVHRYKPVGLLSGGLLVVPVPVLRGIECMQPVMSTLAARVPTDAASVQQREELAFLRRLGDDACVLSLADAWLVAKPFSDA